MRFCEQFFLTCWLLFIFSSHQGVEAFSIFQTTPSRIKLFSKGNEGHENAMANQSFLSHVMLKVPSVDRTIAYWIENGGRIRFSKEKSGTDKEAELLSAFLELGRNQPREDAKDGPECFALELVTTDKEKYCIGDEISYIGVSMLMGAVVGDKKPLPQGDEPNGIPIKSAASAPGNNFARFALKSRDLDATSVFYTSVLGMEVKARDEKMLCLRYDNDCFQSGVATTLVFDAAAEDFNMGDCFDHLAIDTKNKIDEIYAQTKAGGCNIFMKPTEMFGKQVMGLIDPNGYKIVIFR